MSSGGATQASGSRKTGSVTAMHPIGRSAFSWSEPPVRRASRRTISNWLTAPLPSSKTSQARQAGRIANREKSPNPAIAFCGAFSLKKKSSPGCSARKFAVPGRQKLTSPTSGRARKKRYQSKSVRATKPRTGVEPQPNRCLTFSQIRRTCHVSSWSHASGISHSRADWSAWTSVYETEGHRFESCRARFTDPRSDGPRIGQSVRHG